MKFIVRAILWVLILVIGSYLWSQFREETLVGTQYKVRVVTSFYPMYFFSDELVGNRGDVTMLVPSGVEPHDYELSTGDIRRLERSDLVVINGLGLEPWGGRLGDLTKAEVVVAGEGLAGRKDGEVLNPHVWLSPVLAEQETGRILDALLKIDPENAKYYMGNAEALRGKLGELDKAYAAGLVDCGLREFITTHAAFGYLAQEYGLREVPMAGFSPDAEPTPREFADLADYARSRGISSVMYDPLSSSRWADAFAAEIGGQTLELHTLESLPSNVEDDYFSIQKDNLVSLRTALQCQ